MAATDLGTWDPLEPSEVAGLLEACCPRWWIAGGYAIDAFVGRFDRRPHDDIDVGLLAWDQALIRGCLEGWDWHCADPPGHLRPWRPNEVLQEPIHDVWARERVNGPWRLQLVLNPGRDETWIYRRDSRIRLHVSELVWCSDGIPYLVPEVQLLFKSKTARTKDEQDLEDSLPLLSTRQRTWLREALHLSSPMHPWLDRL